MNGRFHRWLALMLAVVLTVSLCPITAEAEVDASEPVSIKLVSEAEGNLSVGESVQLIANVEPAEAAGCALSWSSSDETVAAVSEEGLVTALAVGSSDITAMAENGVSAVLTLTVVESVETEPEDTEEPVVEEPTEEPQPETEELPAEEQLPEEELPAVEEESPVEELPAEEDAPTVEEPAEGEEVPEDVTTEEGEETEDEAETEEESAELPFGLAGMPEDFVLSEEALAEKEALGALAVKLAEMYPGWDYAENEVMTKAANEEEAALIAAAFNGEVKNFRHGNLVIALKDCTVLDAITVAADVTLPFPAVYPNYIRRVEPVPAAFSLRAAAAAPVEQTWESWVRDTMQNPDTFLLDPYYSNLFEDFDGNLAGYQWHHDAVDTYAAWGVSTGSGVTVAVIDTGVQGDHPDLGGRVIPCDIGCGTEPKSGHGTQVAGVIAASMDNGMGGAGIAPYATILSYCVAYDEYGNMFDYDIISAIYDAVDNGADIINMSYGGIGYNPLQQEAIDYAYDNGVTCIAAMGNTGSNAIEYPAAYEHVIAVTATDKSNNRAWFSNYGNWSDVSAPGLDIISTTWGSSYIQDNGTSFAAPMVSGLAALYMSSRGQVDPDAMEKALEKSMVSGVVNGAKLFSGDKTQPTYEIVHEGERYQLADFGKNPIPCESKLWLDESIGDEGSVILFTTNGKTPSIKNGEVINGEYYTGGIDLSQFAGKTVTVKAARVTGMGVLGKVLTLKLKIAESFQIMAVVVKGPDTIVSGRIGIYSAEVYPIEKAMQDVEWSIVDYAPTLKGITIDTKGNLKTPTNGEGTVTIRATSLADPNQWADKIVSVEKIAPVAKITFKSSRLTVPVGEGVMFFYELWDAKGNQINPEYVDVQFVSSNAKVVRATGDEYQEGEGGIDGLMKGSATVTVKALDGSKKSAKFSVSVIQPVNEIAITGNLSIAPGYSGTYKATAYPTNANNKKVTWELLHAPDGVTIKGSTVKVAKTVPAGSNFTVRAKAADGYGADAEFDVYVLPRTKAVKVDYSNYSGEDFRPVYNTKTDSIKSVELYTVDRPDFMDYDETRIDLMGLTDNGIPCRWTTSSPSVASITVDGNFCHVQAKKAGTAKISCYAQDGSGKSTSLTVKVTTPASRVHISTTAPRMTNDIPYLAFGKSISCKAVFGSTYGTPSSKKVTWDVDVHAVDASGEVDFSFDYADYSQTKKYISMKSGKLTVKAGLKNFGSEFRAYIYCNDTYWNYDVLEVCIIPATTVITPLEKTVKIPSDFFYVTGFTSDQWNPGQMGYNNAFTVTSSNPKLVSVQGVYPAGYEDEHGEWHLIPGTYELYLNSGKSGIKGKATITIKANDGSGKSTRFTVDVNDKYWENWEVIE